MKKKSIPAAFLVLLMGIFLLIPGCKSKTNVIEYLHEVLNNLGQIQSAAYYSTQSGYVPTHSYYIMEFVNPKDTIVGVSFIMLDKEDTAQMEFCYDGNMRALVYRDEKRLVLDSFKINYYPFRLVHAPFFARAKTLIKYALETTDSITIDSKDYEDSIRYTISIYDDIIEFIENRPVHDTLCQSGKGEVSRYDLWVRKSDGLPYRMKREMPHDMTIEAIISYKLNEIRIKDFKASDYFPSGFTIQDYGSRGHVAKNEMEGKFAPDWVLTDLDDNTVAFKDFKSKVFMIEFTSVSCGPCREAIPFLNQLSAEYDKKDFDFISIDNWMKDTQVIKGYQNRNQVNYNFLLSTKDVTRSYQVKSVPVFFIIDKNRVIRKIITGYSKGATDREIRDAINNLL